LAARRHALPSLSGFSSRSKLLEYEPLLEVAAVAPALTGAIVVGAAMVSVGESAACALIDPARISAAAQQTLEHVVRMVDNMMAPFFIEAQYAQRWPGTESGLSSDTDEVGQ
jgi:hypothetical protein